MRLPYEPDLGDIEPIELVEPNPPDGFDDITRALVLAGRQESVVPPPTSEAIWAAAKNHRIASLLASVTNDQPGIVREVALLQLRLTAAAREVGGLLDRHGIPYRILKGLATGPLDYPTGLVRHTGDVDLLVAPSDFEQACELIAAESEPLKSDLPADLIVERTFRTDGGIELDVHHRLFRFGPPHTNELFAQTDTIPGVSLPALDSAGRLIHAAGHLLFSPPGHRRLSSLIDVAILDESPQLDWDRAARISSDLGIVDIVEVARWLADAIGNPDAPPPPRVGSSPINRAHIRGDRSIAWETAAVLGDLNGVSERLRYLNYQARRLNWRRPALKRPVSRAL